MRIRVPRFSNPDRLGYIPVARASRVRRLRVPGLGEDRLQVVLHGVLRKVHAQRDVAGVPAGAQVGQQLGLPPAETERPPDATPGRTAK